MHLTHNESIKTLNDASCHLELEEDRIEASRPNADVYMASSILKGGKSFKSKSYDGYKGKGFKRHKGGHFGNNNNNKAKGKAPMAYPQKNKAKTSVIIMARRVTLLVSVTSQRRYKPLKCFQGFLMFLKVPFMFLVLFI